MILRLIYLNTLICLLVLPTSGKTRVRIEGLKQMSERQMLELIGDRLAHVYKKPASPSRADDAAFLLTQVMLNDGYSQVAVVPYISSPDEIVLRVQEGARLSLGTLSLTGVDPIEQADLLRLFTRPAEKSRPLGSGSAPYQEEDMEEGLANLRQEFKARGHWLATAEITDGHVNAITGQVDLTIHVEPGPVFTIGPPIIESSDGRGVVRTSTTAQPFIGRKADTTNINALRQAVEEAFFSRGYPNAQIIMTQELRGDQFVPHFIYDLGTRVRLLKIRTEGLQRTREFRVLRRVDELEGEWYDEATMQKRVRDFLSTGAFRSVRVETTEVAHKRIDATLHFQEAKAKEISIAAGFGSYEGLISRFTYTDRNIGGLLMGFNAGFEVSSRGLLGEVRLTDPWVYGENLAASSRVYALIFGREGYETFETGVEGKLTWTPNDHYTLETLLGYSLVNTSADGMPFTDLGETVYFWPRLRFTQTLDYRDSPVIPTSGWHLKLPIELGAATGNTSSSYLKLGLSGAWYYPLNRNYHLAVGGQAQMILPSGNSRDFPIDLRLFNGGARSVRSFPERELGPSSVSGDPLGGEMMWATNIELSRKLVGSLKGVAFFDAGSVAREYQNMGSTELEMAIGLGLRLNLPVGPVRLEYGYNLTRDRGEPSGTLHFAIGAAF